MNRTCRTKTSLAVLLLVAAMSFTLPSLANSSPQQADTIFLNADIYTHINPESDVHGQPDSHVHTYSSKLVLGSERPVPGCP